MEDELSPFIDEYKIAVRRQYIDNEPALVEQYGDKVPVLTLDNETLCEYFLDPGLLRRVIESNQH